MQVAINQVTPLMESVPVRSYKRDGSNIRCFEVLGSKGYFPTRLTLSESPIFEINLPTEEIAGMLMEDLYYGEYTGG